MASRLAVQTLFSMKIPQKNSSLLTHPLTHLEGLDMSKKLVLDVPFLSYSQRTKKASKIAFFHWFLDLENCQYLGIGNR